MGTVFTADSLTQRLHARLLPLKGYEGNCEAMTQSTRDKHGNVDFYCELKFGFRGGTRSTRKAPMPTLEKAVETAFEDIDRMALVEIRPALPRHETIKNAISHKRNKAA